MKSCTILIILLAHAIIADAFFSSKVEELKNRAKNLYKKHFKKENKWQFIGEDPDLYPGTNKKARVENAKKWSDYYECLMEQEQAIGPHGTPTPAAMQGFEGAHVRFQCNFCFSPDEQDKLQVVEWYFGEVGMEYLSIIYYNEHIMLSPEDKILHVYNLKKEHAGQYVCVLGDSATVPYYLNVNDGENMLLVHSEFAKKTPHSSPAKTIPNYNLIVTTEWGEWSECNRCAEVGKRHRMGYCNVVHQSIKKRANVWAEIKHVFLNDSFSFKHYNKTKNQTEDDALQAQPMHVELVRIFQDGIPCKSHILPMSIKHLTEVKERQDEIMIGYCKVPCPPDKIFIVKDKHGKEIERANNSAGIYSTLQGVPPSTPEVDRVIQYERRDTNILIVCPGNLNTDAAVKWLVQGKEMIAEAIERESNGRIYISLLDRIHIKKTQVSDSNLYTCWQNNELAGTVRLVVENKMTLTFNHHILLFGLLLILSVLAFVFLKALSNRKYAREALQ